MSPEASHAQCRVTCGSPFDLHYLAICNAVSALCEQQGVDEEKLFIWLVRRSIWTASPFLLLAPPRALRHRTIVRSRKPTKLCSRSRLRPSRSTRPSAASL